MTKHYYEHTISGVVKEIEDLAVAGSSLWRRTDKKPRCDDYRFDIKDDVVPFEDTKYTNTLADDTNSDDVVVDEDDFVDIRTSLEVISEQTSHKGRKRG